MARDVTKWPLTIAVRALIFGYGILAALYVKGSKLLSETLTLDIGHWASHLNPWKNADYEYVRVFGLRHANTRNESFFTSLYVPIDEENTYKDLSRRNGPSRAQKIPKMRSTKSIYRMVGDITWRGQVPQPLVFSHSEFK